MHIYKILIFFLKKFEFLLDLLLLDTFVYKKNTIHSNFIIIFYACDKDIGCVLQENSDFEKFAFYNIYRIFTHNFPVPTPDNIFLK